MANAPIIQLLSYIEQSGLTNTERLEAIQKTDCSRWTGTFITRALKALAPDAVLGKVTDIQDRIECLRVVLSRKKEGERFLLDMVLAWLDMTEYSIVTIQLLIDTKVFSEKMTLNTARSIMKRVKKGHEAIMQLFVPRLMHLADGPQFLEQILLIGRKEHPDTDDRVPDPYQIDRDAAVPRESDNLPDPDMIPLEQDKDTEAEEEGSDDRPSKRSRTEESKDEEKLLRFDQALRDDVFPSGDARFRILHHVLEKGYPTLTKEEQEKVGFPLDASVLRYVLQLVKDDVANTACLQYLIDRCEHYHQRWTEGLLTEFDLPKMRLRALEIIL